MSCAESSVTKKIYGSTSDFISNLPDAIIENILTRVPLRDAVRTSVLSTRWRYAWAKLQDLVIDNTLCKCSLQHQVVLQYKVMLIVYQVLHRIQTVRKFCLSFKLMASCPEIDNLIIRLSSTGIEEFTLHIWLGNPHKLPVCLFSYQKLRHLNLYNCVFSPPATFRGFSKLVFLELVEVCITEDSLVRLISSCKLLESLKFQTYMNTTYVHMEIESPSLKFLRFTGTFRSICFKNAPNLATISLRSKELVSPVEPNKGDLFYYKLPARENLEIDGYYVKSFSAGVRLSPENGNLPPKHLKILKLDGVDLDLIREFSLAILLMSSPSLRSLIIKVNFSGQNMQGRQFVKARQRYSFQQLQDVRVDSVVGTKTEIEFLKFILTKSRNLEKMVITPHPSVADKGFAILKALSCCERMSRKAKLII